MAHTRDMAFSSCRDFLVSSGGVVLRRGSFVDADNSVSIVGSEFQFVAKNHRLQITDSALLTLHLRHSIW